jgi:prepilin-type N-terminal cleavage/methylation domain-containing protein
MKIQPPGFTLIEVLIVVGVIGVISSVVIVAINPSKQLCESRDAERKVHVRELGNALYQHLIGEWQTANTDIPLGEANAMPVCRAGITEDETCINLDSLVPEYISQLPVDPEEVNANHSGYSVYVDDHQRVQVLSLHVGQCPEPATELAVEGDGDGEGGNDGEEEQEPCILGGYSGFEYDDLCWLMADASQDCSDRCEETGEPYHTDTRDVIGYDGETAEYAQCEEVLDGLASVLEEDLGSGTPTNAGGPGGTGCVYNANTDARFVDTASPTSAGANPNSGYRRVCGCAEGGAEEGPVAGTSELRFDFGQTGSPVSNGFTQVTRFMWYSAPTGYGWSGSLPTSDGDIWNGPTSVLRDYVSGSTTPGTFVADVTNGEYDVTVHYQGDSSNMHVTMEGIAVDTVNHQQYQFDIRTYRVTVNDGQFTLVLQDLDSWNKIWKISGIEILPAEDIDTPPALTSLQADFGDYSSPVANGYVQIVPITFYTETQQYGWLGGSPTSFGDIWNGPTSVLRDYNYGELPTTFVADVENGEYDVTVHYQGSISNMRVMMEGLVFDTVSLVNYQYDIRKYRVTVSDNQFTLLLQDLDASNKAWKIAGIQVLPAENNPEPPPLTSFKGDFGQSGSPIATGYQQIVIPTIYSVERQYGWLGGSVTSDGDVWNGPSSILRDYVYSDTPTTFVVDMANGNYNVTVYYQGSVSNMQLTMEGAVVDTVTLGNLVYDTRTYPVTISDTQFTLLIQDIDAFNKAWKITGIDIISAP